MMAQHGSTFFRAVDIRIQNTDRWAFSLILSLLHSFSFNSTPCTTYIDFFHYSITLIFLLTTEVYKQNAQTVTSHTDDSSFHSITFPNRCCQTSLDTSTSQFTGWHSARSRKSYAVGHLSGTVVSQGSPNIIDSLKKAYSSRDQIPGQL